MNLEDLAFPATPQAQLRALETIAKIAADESLINLRATLAIDPGTDQSGWCLYDGSVIDSGVADNHDILSRIKNSTASSLAIEMISSYGMPVGRETFETVRWIGRFQQAWHSPESVRLIFRRDIKIALCGTTKAKDANVRQAILDRFPRSGGGKTPQVGTKSKPGPLYGVKSHAWSALAVAVVHEMIKGD